MSANTEGSLYKNVTNFNTYTNLLFHGYSEQDDEVENENWPEHRDVEEIKHCTEYTDQQRLQCTVPANQCAKLPMP